MSYLIHDEPTQCYVEIHRNAIPEDMQKELISIFERDCNVAYPIKRFFRKEGESEYIMQKRYNCFYADDDVDAILYSQTEIPAIPWNPVVAALRDFVSQDRSHGAEFLADSCLVNGYILPDHNVGLHRDKDLEDGNNVVCTVSLGGTRVFRYVLDKKYESTGLPRKVETYLHSGDIVFMYGNTNAYYSHEIPVMRKMDLKLYPFEPRYSATFRKLKGGKGLRYKNLKK